MAKKRQNSRLPLAQFVAIIVLSISVFLVIDLARRTAANYRVQREAYRLAHEVEAARAYQAHLRELRSYVASDLYVEEVARNELKWARPSETVIVVLPVPKQDSRQYQTRRQASPPRQVATPAEAWWYLFFGDSPMILSPAEYATNPPAAEQAAASKK